MPWQTSELFSLRLPAPLLCVVVFVVSCVCGGGGGGGGGVENR